MILSFSRIFQKNKTKSRFSLVKNAAGVYNDRNKYKILYYILRIFSIGEFYFFTKNQRKGLVKINKWKPNFKKRQEKAWERSFVT